MTALHFATAPDDADPAVWTRGVKKRYGGPAAALDGVDLQVPTGAVYVLAGRNGAGKTTTFKLLLDIVRADEGTASVLGIDPARQPALARAQIGYAPELVTTSYPWLSVLALLRYHAAFHPTWDWGYAAALCRRFGLREGERFRELSKGGARSVALVTALAHRPPVLLLDEPTDGLDPLARDELGAVLVEHMTRDPTTVIWSTHHIHEADPLADHLGVLSRGRLVMQASADAIRARVRRYRLQVPDGWAGAPGLNGEVLTRASAGRDVTWVVWGDEREVAERLSASGATVREAARVPLPEAAVAVMRAAEAA